MIYEYRDSRDGHVFASQYGRSMTSTQMMYVAMSHDVPMCRIEWRRYCEGFWSEWVKLVPDLTFPDVDHSEAAPRAGGND